MSAPLFLTGEELADLTGYKSQKHQAQWLKARGWKFETNASGQPRVLRAFMESRMGAVSQARQRRTEPDWGALEA